MEEGTTYNKWDVLLLMCKYGRGVLWYPAWCWKSSIRLDTKIRLYQTYIVPVLLYGCETWSN